jgi:hypothetical protein
MHAGIAGTVRRPGNGVTAGTLSARYDRLGDAAAGVAYAATTAVNAEPSREIHDAPA